jgi:AcrR family transcriptional regulator
VRSLVAAEGHVPDFSIDTVAERAGVSRMTVYHQFHSRSGLLEALADRLAERGGMAGLRAAFVEPDSARAVRRFVEVFVGFWASDRLVLRRLRALAVVMPSLYRRLADRDRWRRQGAATLIDRFLSDRRSGRGKRRDDLVDLFTALTSFELFDQLAADGRTAEDAARILWRLAISALGLEST